MIIKDDDKTLPLRPEQVSLLVTAFVPSLCSNRFLILLSQQNVDALPPYSPFLPPRPETSPASFSVASSSSSLSPPSPTSVVPSIPRSNFLSIQRNNTSLKGSYVIDPTLDVPEAVLPPLEPGQERKNLLLECQNGGINAEVYLVGPGVGGSAGEEESENGMSKKRPTTIEVTGRNGFIALKLVRLSASTNDAKRSLAMPMCDVSIVECRKRPSIFTPDLRTQWWHIARYSK